MSRIDVLFRSARNEGRGLLMPFVVAGYPGLDATEMLLHGLKDAGAAVAEIGFPFSDPIADGPVIAEAMHEALTNGITVDAVFGTAARVRERTDLGLIAMVSESIVHRRGGERFIRQAADAGFDGFIIPDIDLLAADALLPTIDELDLSLALLVAPTTTEARLQEVLRRCRGMVYLLARAGVTGAREDLPDVEARVALIRRHTDLPIAIGFGISTPEQVKAATEHCDAAIVGSALVDRMRSDGNAAEAGLAVVQTLATGL